MKNVPVCVFHCPTPQASPILTHPNCGLSVCNNCFKKLLEMFYCVEGSGDAVYRLLLDWYPATTISMVRRES